MTNPPRIKGTRYEGELVPLLRLIFGEHVDRSALHGVYDKGDFYGVPFPVEAKARETLAIPAWVRRVREKAQDHRWVIFCKQDRRKVGSIRELMIVDAEFGRELLLAYEQRTRI